MQVMIRTGQVARLDARRDSKQPSLFVVILGRNFTRCQNMVQCLLGLSWLADEMIYSLNHSGSKSTRVISRYDCTSAQSTH